MTTVFDTYYEHNPIISDAHARMNALLHIIFQYHQNNNYYSVRVLEILRFGIIAAYHAMVLHRDSILNINDKGIVSAMVDEAFYKRVLNIVHHPPYNQLQIELVSATFTLGEIHKVIDMHELFQRTLPINIANILAECICVALLVLPITEETNQLRKKLRDNMIDYLGVIKQQSRDIHTKINELTNDDDNANIYV